MRTSIFRIEAAMDGKVEFVRATNPWGAVDDKPPVGQPHPPAEANPAKAANALMGFLRAQA